MQCKASAHAARDEGPEANWRKVEAPCRQHEKGLSASDPGGVKVKRLLTILAVLLSFTLVAAACGSDDDDSASDDADTTQPADAADDTADDAADDAAADDTTDDSDDAAMAEHLGDGSLGVVSIEEGDEIQIRSLNAITGDVAFLGIPNQRGVEQAIADYGAIHGFDVSMGAGLDDLCSADGGQAAAQTIVADEQILGVIGTSCSGAATAASPLISEAGMVMISGSNTSPLLTSDQAGTVGKDYQPGYYRTAHNDLFQGKAMAEYVVNVLGLTKVAAIHDGDPYTSGLSFAFGDALEDLGGEFTGIAAIAKGDSDMVPVLTELAAGGPEAIFYPLFQPESDFMADQMRGVSGLEDVVMLSADASLNSDFMALPQSAGIHFSGPDTRFGENKNQSTGVTAAEVLATYEANNGETPSAPFWGHSYDAAAMLLDAIEAASWVEDGTLMVDRAGIREHLNNIRGYEGLIGLINCDDFGDCGSQKITVIEHLDPNDVQASLDNVVYEYAPS